MVSRRHPHESMRPALPESPHSTCPLVLVPSPGGETRLPGVDGWLAEQKRKASAEQLRRELASLQPVALDSPLLSQNDATRKDG